MGAYDFQMSVKNMKEVKNIYLIWWVSICYWSGPAIRPDQTSFLIINWRRSTSTESQNISNILEWTDSENNKNGLVQIVWNILKQSDFEKLAKILTESQNIKHFWPFLAVWFGKIHKRFCLNLKTFRIFSRKVILKK